MNGTGLTMEQVQGLADMLDSTNAQSKAAMNRPDTQTVGYSWSETPTPDAVKEGVPKHQVAVNSNPGAIYVPETVKDKQVLPVISKTKEGQKLLEAAAGGVRPKPKGNDIWSTEEIDYAPVLPSTAATQISDSTTASRSAVDKRVAPEYEVLYKQVNTAEDVYLSMDFTRDGSTAMSCDGLAVRVKMPLLSSVKDVELDVEPFVMILRTKDYHLRANLPEKVIAKKGAAQWDATKKVLTVQLTIDPADRKVKVL